MHIILGATGHIGSAAAHALLAEGEAVTAVTRNASHAQDLKDAGAVIAEADIHDTKELNRIFRTGKRALLVNPPADPSGDTDREERKTVASIVDAIKDSGLEKVVVASVTGARPGDHCGDLTVLYELEQKLLAQEVPAAINRGAYYMSNWTAMLDAVRETGKVQSFLPADMTLPMVSPDDLGTIAAGRMLDGTDDVAVWHVEGPERYSPSDVAQAFHDVLGRSVVVDVVPRDRWIETYRHLGFSQAAAESYANMTETTVDAGGTWPDNPIRGETTLREYVRSATSRQQH